MDLEFLDSIETRQEAHPIARASLWLRHRRVLDKAPHLAGSPRLRTAPQRTSARCTGAAASAARCHVTPGRSRRGLQARSVRKRSTAYQMLPQNLASEQFNPKSASTRSLQNSTTVRNAACASLPCRDGGWAFPAPRTWLRASRRGGTWPRPCCG